MTSPRKRLYWIWADMLSRCRNKNHRNYKNYGARGISVCERWNDFGLFEKDMGLRPEGLSLDRKDNNIGYGPNNCRWATRVEQNSNRRSCIYIECDGSRVTLKEYCRRKAIPYRPIVKRIKDRNWPLEKALSVPVGSGKLYGRIPRKEAA